VQVLATWTPEDGILGAVAPLGLAAAQPQCLVIDLDERGPTYPGDLTLADLIEDGPTREQLSPTTGGLAVLGNGGVGLSSALEVVSALSTSWPAVVLRLPATRLEVPWPVVKVRPLLPGNLFGAHELHAVYQQSGWRIKAPDGAFTLPVPRAQHLAALLSGIKPARSAWVKAWRAVWQAPWV